ncbi:acyl-CoA N-acyltransferase [Phanerochaete sordida]|uniref:histone acetyltransferase n=1 Tax=Phanerochaete sordida TaxID=48140 RepID=A0A9P3LDZ7_9APHY|nr:acyl-CoA N-acyltransferase [Phanerochaete sordida]
MPQTFYVPQLGSESCLVSRNGAEQQAHILERRPGEVYVHYDNTDKRMDEWVSESLVKPTTNPEQAGSVAASHASNGGSNGTRKKRKRAQSSNEPSSGAGTPHPPQQEPTPRAADGAEEGKTIKMSEEEYDIEHHKQITARRNFDRVIFGKWSIRTWYFSPYPLAESEGDSEPSSTPAPPPAVALFSASAAHTSRALPTSIEPRLPRASMRAHGRTSDLFAGGLGRERTHGNDSKETESVLWVCDRCFKYMTEGAVWEGHCRKCTRTHPPGRKVYQRGAHIIWEVDGAKEKLYCQNLSLFGKLFIDIKTLFFDCDNFLFYILTDADSTRDHVIGFFSKEKISYDDYNLACIVVLPPYQKNGYGMLLIEFSYELSKRAGKLGTPERPLSDLGLRSYMTYWIATIIRYLRRLLSVLPPDVKHLISPQKSSAGSSSDGSPTPNHDAVESVLSILSPPLDDDWPANGHGTAPRRRKKSAKGWDGEAVMVSSNGLGALEEPDDLVMQQRVLQTTANADGSATTHLVVRCTLQELSTATGLRADDAAFALEECGLLRRRLRKKVERKTEDGLSERDEEEYIVVTRELVEAVATERRVKKMCMDLQHVLL